MRPALHPHISAEDISVYDPLPHQLTTSAPTYPAFPPSLHHVNSNDHSGYGVSPPADHHTLPSQHDHLEDNGLQLDPTLSPDARHFASDSTPLQQHHDFTFNTRKPADANKTPPPPPPLTIPNSLPPGHFDMLPPPPSTHPSWQALHEYAQTHASAHGYALSINTTAKNRSRIKLACVCYGAPKNTHKLTPETRVRKNRVSYKTGCKMWIEGKKHDDGVWVLRVGNGTHNHPGRAIEGWAVQRKRTWGVQGGRVGVGGVTAKEEKERVEVANGGEQQAVGQDESLENEDQDTVASPQKASHSLESGGLVWKIVEQEMLRKGGPGQGRDRGVGRTVKILEERLPGIHIFKRDVYNIRAQIKRTRKAAGQQLGEGLDDSDNEEEADADETQRRSNARLQAQNHNSENGNHERNFSKIDPTLIAQCNSALQNIPNQNHTQQESEVDRLRKEVAELKQALAQRTKELNEKTSENESLKGHFELAHIALYNGRRVGGGATQ